MKDTTIVQPLFQQQWCSTIRLKMENRRPSTKADIPKSLLVRINGLRRLSFVPWWLAQRWRWVPSCWWPVLRRLWRCTSPTMSTVWSLFRPQPVPEVRSRPVTSRWENLMDWVVKTARGGVRDPGKRGRNGVIGSSLKPAMCRTIDHPTIAVGPTLIPTKKNMLHCLNAVIPRATMTATRTTTKMGCGMCRHPSRMVPVACRASTLKRSRQGLVFVFKDAFFLRFSIPNTRRHTQNKYYK